MLNEVEVIIWYWYSFFFFTFFVKPRTPLKVLGNKFGHFTTTLIPKHKKKHRVEAKHWYTISIRVVTRYNFCNIFLFRTQIPLHIHIIKDLLIDVFFSRLSVLVLSSVSFKSILTMHEFPKNLQTIL